MSYYANRKLAAATTRRIVLVCTTWSFFKVQILKFSLSFFSCWLHCITPAATNSSNLNILVWSTCGSSFVLDFLVVSWMVSLPFNRRSLIPHVECEWQCKDTKRVANQTTTSDWFNTTYPIQPSPSPPIRCCCLETRTEVANTLSDLLEPW